MSSTGFVTIYSGDVRTIDSVASHDLGTLGQTPDGRLYRYSQAGAADLAPGKLCVAATQVADHANIAVAAAAAVAATQVSVTLGATLATKDQYEGGYLTVNDATGEGVSYRIRANDAGDASATITVYLAEPIQVALTTSSEVSLVKNPWDSVVISATDQADMPVGIPNVTITAAYFGWIQTGGACAALADEAITAGLALTTGTGTAGAVEALDAAGEFQLGVALQAGVDTEYRTIYLSID